MVDLPLEIIQRIITISLPRSLVDYRTRIDLLLPLGFLHSSLRRFVQRLLFVHPVFIDFECAALFVATVEGSQSDFYFGGCVKSLRMYGSWDEATVGDTDRLFSRLCESCDAIEEIWIHSLENVNFARFAKLRSEQRPTIPLVFADDARCRAAQSPLYRRQLHHFRAEGRIRFFPVAGQSHVAKRRPRRSQLPHSRRPPLPATLLRQRPRTPPRSRPLDPHKSLYSLRRFTPSSLPG